MIGYKVRGFFDGVRTRGPVLGGQFAVWGSLFAAFDCSITHVRGKENWINSVAAGAFTSGVLAIRGGLKPFLLNAMVGGFMLGVIEGLGHVLGQAFKPPENIQQEPLLKTSFGVEALAIKEKKKKSFQEKEIESICLKQCLFLCVEKRALVYNPELLDIDYRKETLLSDEIKYL